MKTKLSVKHFYELEWYHVYLGSSKSSLMLYLLYNNHNKSHVKNVFFFFSILIDQGKRVRIFYFLFFFHLDAHFYFSKMEKMKIKIWREGESIIVHLITFFLFLLHFIFLSTIKKKKKNTRFQLIIIYEYTIIYGDGLLSMPLRPWPKAPISKNLHFYF